MRNPRVWIGLAVSLVTLYLAFKDINFALLRDALAQANYLALIPAMLVIVVAQLLRAYRWGQLFYPDPSPPFKRLFSSLSIGYLVSTVYPARLGDIVRAVLIGGRDGQRVAQAFSTVVVERALDVFSIIAFLVFLLPFVSLPPLVFRSAVTIAVIFVVLTVALWIAAWQRDRSIRLIHWVLSRIPRIDADRWTHSIGGLLDGLAILRAPKRLAQMGLLSLFIWGFGGVGFNYLVMRAFGLQNQVVPPGSALVAAAFVQILVALGATVPSSPGYVGVYHAATVLALTTFGIPPTEALAYAVVAHAVNFGLLIIIGLYYLWREGLSLGELASQTSQSAKTEPSEAPAKAT